MRDRVGLDFLAVSLNGTLLGYAVEIIFALPVYFIIRDREKINFVQLLILGACSGVIGSLSVKHLEQFRQPALHAFAESIYSQVLGVVCGLVSAFVFGSVLRWGLTRNNDPAN